MSSLSIVYNAEPTATRFHNDNAFYRCMRGPVRSGKSTSMCAEIVKRASEQAPGPDGIRRTRFAVIRNTYRELEDTTLKTWLMWYPEGKLGRMNKQNMVYTLQFNDIICEVLFRALDRPKDVAKLLSLELTAAWINEAREVPKVIVDTVGDRVCQYPQKQEIDGVQYGCTWGGVFMDTNAPDEDHWWFDLEANPPQQELSDGTVVQWKFFTQPGALRKVKDGYEPNPKAENIGNLNEGHDYYLKRLMGKSDSYIDVYYCNQFGYAQDGKRVHPEYNDTTHCSVTPLIPDPDHPVYVGLDFGLTPAAVFGSRRPNGQWLIFHEIATEDIGIKPFGERLLLPYILEHLMEYDIKTFGDPYGNNRSQTEADTPLDILETMGFNIELPNVKAGPDIRRESLAAVLNRMIDGQPGLLVDPSCKVLRKGLSSKYVFKRMQVVGDEKYQDKPDKNFWSHTCEALQHLMVGAGEAERIIRPRNKAGIDWNARYIGKYMEPHRNNNVNSGWMVA